MWGSVQLEWIIPPLHTSNNIWVFLWWLFIYSGTKFAYLFCVQINFYKLVSWKKICKQTQHTKHNTHNNNKMSRCRPTLQRLCPLSSWVGQRWPQIMVPWLPMSRHQALGVRIPLAAIGSLVWANKFNPSKNRVIGGGLALCGRRLMMWYHNQPESWRPR